MAGQFADVSPIRAIHDGASDATDAEKQEEQRSDGTTQAADVPGGEEFQRVARGAVSRRGYALATAGDGPSPDAAGACG